MSTHQLCPSFSQAAQAEQQDVQCAPSNGSNLLALPGGDGGGLFLSTNAGASWTSITPGICDVHVEHAAFHPTNPSTIFAATRQPAPGFLGRFRLVFSNGRERISVRVLIVP